MIQNLIPRVFGKVTTKAIQGGVIKVASLNPTVAVIVVGVGGTVVLLHAINNKYHIGGKGPNGWEFEFSPT